jgi:ABC-2 type transport system ATP-binding protein
MPAIEVNDLRKAYRTKIKPPGLSGALRSLLHPGYREFLAVDGVSFAVEPGEVLGFIGPNGAGKSTTIKMLCGILTPTSGTVSVLGFDPIRDRGKMLYKIGTVFGPKSQLWIHIPPVETFKLLGAIYDIDDRTLKTRIDELAAAFDLGGILDTPVRKLSLGQRMKCEVAASLLHRPPVIFLDEPTIGLDVIVKKSIRDLIGRMNRDQGTTIILTSHDISDIEKLCHRVIIINHGRVVFADTTKNLKYGYLSRKLISLRAEDKLDLDIPGLEIVKQKDNAAKLEIDTAKHPLDQAIAAIIARNSVVDINVADVPLEEVIAAIYRRTGRQAVNGEP